MSIGFIFFARRKRLREVNRNDPRLFSSFGFIFYYFTPARAGITVYSQISILVVIGAQIEIFKSIEIFSFVPFAPCFPLFKNSGRSSQLNGIDSQSVE